MRCKKCAFENPQDMKFCGQCGETLSCPCPVCQFSNPSGFKFCGKCSAPLVGGEALPVVEKTTSPKTDATKPGIEQPDAEHRQLTVLFCDLVGSTALSESTDPEDFRDIMCDYRETCDTVVQRFNGHIAQYLGDGVLVYFGFPRAHEDDASRAARAGLALVAEMKCLNNRLHKEKGIRLDIRIGVHTGMVVVGDLGGQDKRSLALGVTPNIAARLQDMAEPNTIVVSDDTSHLIRHDFDFTPLGTCQPKGLSHPFQVFQVLREKDKYSDAAWQQGGTDTPLIGREQEAALLKDRLEQSMNGSGQVALLSGEAGIGKSRLAQYLCDQVAAEPHYLLQCSGSPYYQNSYLHCAINILNRLLGIDSKTDNAEKITALETPLASFDISLSESVPLLADLLGLDLPAGHYPELGLAPLQQKQKTMEALLSLVIAMSSRRLVFIVVEDVQWIDPTTLELIGMLIDQTPTCSVFALLTYRTDFTPPWSVKAHLSHITINRLTRKQTGRMIHSIAGNKKLPAEVFNEIISKTDGTPFFIEELTKMVLGSNLLKDTGNAYTLNAPLSSLAIPSTLQDSLMARLDRLGPEKELAQLSAALGREFGHSLLKAVAAREDTRFETGLSHLVGTELLYQHGLPPAASYTFRHALVHDVAYQSLLKKTRQQYHHHIASVITENFPDMKDQNPEILAHHCTEAGNITGAIHYWLAAGQKALQHSALQDAITHLNRGLTLVAEVEDPARALQFELTFQPLLGMAYMMCEGYGSTNVEQSFTRAYTLCKLAGETEQVVPVLSGLWEYYVVRSELDTALELANMMLAIAKRNDDSTLLLEAQRAVGSTCFWQGKPTEAWEHLKRTPGSDQPDSARRHSGHYSQDTGVARLSNTSCVLWFLGCPDQSQKKALQAVTLAEQLNHPFSLAYACVFSAISCQLCGDVGATKQQADRILQISTQYSFGFWKPMGTLFSVWATLQEDPNPDLIPVFEQALDDYRKTGSRMAHAYFHALLAELYLLTGKTGPVIKMLDKTISEMEVQGMHFFDPELYRLKGMLIAKEQPDNVAAAEAEFQTSVKIARQQGSQSLVLRSSICLARLWQSQNRHEQAISVLEKLLNDFSEGFESRDWLNATALVTELKAGAGIPTTVL